MILFTAILLAFLGIAVAASSRDDIKKEFETFELHQKALRDIYFDAYNKRGLLTMAGIVKANSLPVDEIAAEKKALFALPADATTEENIELARIADKIQGLKLTYFTLIDSVTISDGLKFRALVLAVQNPDKETYPTAADFKNGVSAVIKAENPKAEAIEPSYAVLYAMQGHRYSPSYFYIQAKMGVIKSYYKQPNVDISIETIAKIDKILADNKEADLDVRENFPLDTAARADKMLKALPAYLKTDSDLLQLLNSAEIECNLVRCRSTKYDRKVTRDDVKKEFETFELHQKSLREIYYDAYKNRGLLTMAEIVNVYSLGFDKIAEMKNSLYALPASATTDNNDVLAEIADRIQEIKLNFFTLIDSVTISDGLKFRSLILAVQNPDKTTFPTAADQKLGVTDAIKAENPISADVEKTYANLFTNLIGQRYFAPYFCIQAKMDIIREYYQRPQVGMPKEVIEEIDKILGRNKLASAAVRENYPINSADRVTKVLEALPAYLKTNVDLLQTLKDAQFECSFVRCRSTKNDPPTSSTETPTDTTTVDSNDTTTVKPTDTTTAKPPENSSSVLKTSGSALVTILIVLFFVLF